MAVLPLLSSTGTCLVFLRPCSWLGLTLYEPSTPLPATASPALYQDLLGRLVVSVEQHQGSSSSTRHAPVPLLPWPSSGPGPQKSSPGHSSRFLLPIVGAAGSLVGHFGWSCPSVSALPVRRGRDAASSLSCQHACLFTGSLHTLLFWQKTDSPTVRLRQPHGYTKVHGECGRGAVCRAPMDACTWEGCT